MSQKRKKRNKRNFRTSQKEIPLPNRDENTYLGKVLKPQGNSRFSVLRYYDNQEIKSCELSSQMKGGFRRNKIMVGDEVLLEDQGFSQCLVNEPKKGKEINLKIMGKFVSKDKSRLKAANAYDTYTSHEKIEKEEAAFIFEGESKVKEKAVEDMIDDDFFNNL